jgi:mono/diheme cytochrome c family protein
MITGGRSDAAVGKHLFIAALLCLGLAACGPRRPAEIAFDGAQAQDPAAMRAHGERLTHVLGCTSCHGARLEGAQFDPEMKQYGPIYASNLSLLVPHFSDADLDSIVRRGTHPARKTVWVMPSHLFQHLSDADMRALTASLRSLPPTGRPTPLPQFSPEDRKEIASGKYKPEAQLVRETAGQRAADLGPKFALGRYVAELTCAECHGPTLAGEPGHPPGTPPDLAVAGAYARGEFERLITQGIPTGGRKLNPMMAGVAKYRFSHLTRHERDALYAYLKTRAERPQ